MFKLFSFQQSQRLTVKLKMTDTPRLKFLPSLSEAHSINYTSSSPLLRIKGISLRYKSVTGSSLGYKLYRTPSNSIIKSLFSNCMFKQATVNPQPLIFLPSNEQIANAIQEDSICLHANVFTNPQHNQQVRLAMTNFYLAICSPYSHFTEYLYYTELEFNLKFEVIFQAPQKVHPSHAVSTSRLGFRLIKEGTAAIEFYFKSQALLDIWLKYLSKNLNQYGFHKLYKPIRKLGKGGFATVYEVERVTDKARFAAKAFSKAATINSENPTNKQVLLNEIEMLRTFDSPHVMKLQAVFESENSIYIILQLLADGQLHSRINQKMANFSDEEVKNFLRGMGKALYQIHRYRVMHRDIKPENIMLRGKTGLNPVIVDFGLAADIDSEDYIFYRCGTPGYVAPEIITCKKGQKLNPTCDIFSLGIIFHILLVKRPLFEGKQTSDVYERNKKCQFNLNSSLYKNVDPQAMDLLRKMLKVDPNERITAEQLLKHPFLCEEMQVESQKQIISPATTTGSSKVMNFGEAECQF